MSLLCRQLRDTLLHVVLAEPANLLIHPPHRSLPTSSISYTSFTSFTSTASFTSFTSRFRFTQTLPTFSTPSKHRAHSNARKSIPFMRLLHDSLDTRGPGCQLHATRFFRSTFLPRLNLPYSVPLTPFPATLTRAIIYLANQAVPSYNRACLECVRSVPRLPILPGNISSASG
jgi:hypothetical protein